MCMASTPKAPKPAPAAPPISAPIDADQDVKTAGNEERRRLAAATGRSDTVLTGGQGDMSVAVTGKKKLGGVG